MIWPWRIFFSLVFAVQALAASVTGAVELVDSRDPEVRKHNDYSGVVVWLEPAGKASPTPAPRHATMVQKGKKFRPHVLAIPVGSTVDFPNFDPIFHNAFSNFGGQPFDTGLYPPGTSQSVSFKREGIVRVFCNIHSSMSAIIAVLNTPWYDVTSLKGAFQIEGVPPGEYRLHFWHERARQDTLKTLVKRLEVGSQRTALPTVRISESGYVEPPHKNKYGQDYPPAPSDAVYPGARK